MSGYEPEGRGFDSLMMRHFRTKYFQLLGPFSYINNYDYGWGFMSKLRSAIYGLDSIPKEWIDKLKNKDLIEDCLFE